MSEILIVDDEPALLRTLRINLSARQYAVRTAASGGEALDRAAHSAPDAVLLDLGLPDLDGMDVLRGLRTRSAMPIIVLSGRSGAADKVGALDAGADDYLTKPFLMEELLARLRAVLRRPLGGAPLGRPVIGDHTVDLTATTVTGPRGPVRLTPTEWRILALLVANPGGWCPGGRSCARCGDRPRRRAATTCGSTWPGCGASWSATRAARGT